MDFSLSPEQELLRETARALLRDQCPPALVRAYMDDPHAADPLWARLCEFTGLVHAPTVDLSLFLEEAGAVLAPGPFVPTIALFAPVVAAMGDEQLLARVAAGEVTGSVVFAAPIEMHAVEGDCVDVVAIVGGQSVRLVERPPVRVLEPFDLSRRLAEVDGALTGVEHRVDPAGLEDALDRATVALAAEMIGSARWMLDETLAYVKVREQFGRPIGSFQVLQHRLADMLLLFERAWSSVYYAAMSVDADDPDRGRAVHVAKASAGTAARYIAKEAVQMHGGIGFTWDHDLHLYVRRVYASELLLGSSAWHRDRIADLVL